MMKALIIGGTGTISSSVVELAIARDWDVTLLNRGNKKLPQGAHSIVCDMNNEDEVRAALEGRRFDVVAQFIAYTPEEVKRDIRLFAGKTRQYMFISSASAYQKPSCDHRITESTPLVNPYWEYSRNKAACEDVLMQAHRESGFPFTVIRPSHTYCDAKIPVALHGANGSWQVVKRIMDGKPVVIHGDGSSLWTLTYAADFAVGFVGLMGNPHALANAYHITTDESMTWNMIYETIAAAVGKKLVPCHISSYFIAQCQGKYDFTGELLGDKACTVSFDNSKIKRAVPDFNCTVTMADGIRRAVSYVMAHPELQKEDLEFDAWCDKIIAAQKQAYEAMK